MLKTLTIFFLFLFAPFYTQAAENTKGTHMEGRLLSGGSTVGNKVELDMGLLILLEKDWYTYWRMAGDSGLPPSFDWKDSENVADVKILWPTPKRFTTFDMQSFGYDEQILFPLVVTPKEKGKPVDLHLKLDVVVCHEICIPETLALSKRLEAGNLSPTADLPLLERAKDRLALLKNAPKIGINTAVLSKDAIVLDVYAKEGFDQADLIVEVADVLITTPPQILLHEDDKTRAILKIPAPQGYDFTKNLFGKKARVTFITAHQAVEREFTF